MSLDERKYRILRAIIDDYILTAMPVGSRTLSRKSEIGLSSATIRNEMSDLEEMGYLDQPHTSAGRVPSVRAFRLYVDQLMRVAALGREERDYIRSHIGRATVVLQDVLENTARVLGEVTDYAAAVMLPQSKSVRIEHVQLVPITQGVALLVLVTNAGVFKDTLIRVPADTTPEMLAHLSSELTGQLKGRGAGEVPRAVLQIRTDVLEHNRLAEEILRAVAGSASKAQEGGEVVLGGQTNLLKHPEYNDIDRVRDMFTALEPHGKIAGLMAGRAKLEFSISIGPEIGDRTFEDCSLVTVSYHVGNQQIGTMGVIGPMRMDYARVASVLRQAQKTLNDLLNGAQPPPDQ